jgi:hypothetical protein
VVSIASAIAALAPLIDPHSQIPVLVIYLSIVGVDIFIGACIIVPAFMEQSRHLRVVVAEYFKILSLSEKISAADLRTRAQNNLHVDIKDAISRRAIELLEAEGAIEIPKKT